MLTNFALLDFGTPQLILILAILLLLFGGSKLPELSRSIGESMRELRKGLNGHDDDKNSKNKETPENKSS
jgi:sec-independent protein translocase protein TatA